MTDPRYVFYCLDTAQVAIMGKDICHFYDTYHDRVQYFQYEKDTTYVNAPDEKRFGSGSRI